MMRRVAAAWRAWRRRHPSRLARLLAAIERDEHEAGERLAGLREPGSDWRRP